MVMVGLSLFSTPFTSSHLTIQDEADGRVHITNLVLSKGVGLGRTVLRPQGCSISRSPSHTSIVHSIAGLTVSSLGIF